MNFLRKRVKCGKFHTNPHVSSTEPSTRLCLFDPLLHLSLLHKRGLLLIRRRRLLAGLHSVLQIPSSGTATTSSWKQTASMAPAPPSPIHYDKSHRTCPPPPHHPPPPPPEMSLPTAANPHLNLPSSVLCTSHRTRATSPREAGASAPPPQPYRKRFYAQLYK